LPPLSCSIRCWDSMIEDLGQFNKACKSIKVKFTMYVSSLQVSIPILVDFCYLSQKNFQSNFSLLQVLDSFCESAPVCCKISDQLQRNSVLTGRVIPLSNYFVADTNSSKIYLEIATANCALCTVSFVLIHIF
jgi:hypothetical protein